MPGSASPTIRRRELGALLKALRTEKGWTVEQVAERLEFSASKVSRLETGQRGASARDIRDLCDLFGVEDHHRQQLLDLAAAGKQQAWWQSRGLPYSTYVGLETEAATIRDFGYGLVPGLLQTADYARAVIRAVRPQRTDEVVEQRLAARMARQRLLESENPPQFHTVIDESVLHRVAGSPAIMRAQLDRLLEVSKLPNVSLQVLPYEAGALPASNNKFIILSFRQETLAEVVFIEGLTGDLYLERPEDVKVYREAFVVMRQIAATETQSRGIIASIAADHAG